MKNGIEERNNTQNKNIKKQAKNIEVKAIEDIAEEAIPNLETEKREKIY